MENNQNTYLDKVVEFLVRDTSIDYGKDEIYFPFSSFPPPSSSLFSFSSSSSFSKYCIDVYGLTEQEIGYVWNQYRTIILDKISNK